MPGPKNARTILFALAFFCCQPNAIGEESKALAERLRATRVDNLDAIIGAQFIHRAEKQGFAVSDPYSPDAEEVVQRWSQDPQQDTEVCALRFTDAGMGVYELHGFESATSAAAAGHTVTHRGRCGSCSALQDLAVYLETKDLTTPARACARKTGIGGKKKCFQETIGFTPQCAESWAYNARNTRQECLGACISDYGFWNLLFKRYPASPVDESGQLRPCLQCDEDLSGPGFKYSAGRTRRNSGIESAIPRPGSEIYPVDHSAYFSKQPR